MATGKSLDLKNQKMTQKLGKTLGLFKDTSFIVIILSREFNLRANRRIILCFTRFMLGEDWRKATTSEANTNSIILIVQGKTEFCTFITTLRKNLFR